MTLVNVESGSYRLHHRLIGKLEDVNSDKYDPDVKVLTPDKRTWKTESSARAPVVSVDGIVTVKFWYGGLLSPGDGWNCGLYGPL